MNNILTKKRIFKEAVVKKKKICIYFKTLSLFFPFMTFPPLPVTTKNACGASWFSWWGKDGLSIRLLVRRLLAGTVWHALPTVTLVSTTVIRISDQPVSLSIGASNMLWWRSWGGLLFFEEVTFKLSLKHQSYCIRLKSCSSNPKLLIRC